MSFDDSEKVAYAVPRYRAENDTAFYHFLHGTVPGHQIDFLYRPDVPQGALTQTHFGHLARLIKYIEPRQNATYAFALGNLSRDDVQHEPGRGGLALLFALRVPGVTDHAGRDMPPYAHGVVAVNRALDYVTLLDAATAFYKRFLEQKSADERRGTFYRTYVRTATEQPDELERFLAQYIADFSELPHPGRSELGWDFIADEGAPAKRITIVHDDDESFGSLAHCAAVLGSLLYRSNIKWTSITTGREIEIVGGTTIRFVSKSEAPSETKGASYAIDDLPDDEEELAMLLFGAKRRVEEAVVPRQGWRAKYDAQRGASAPSEPPPPPRTPLPPAPDALSKPDSFDRAEVDDAAATLPMAPLEADPPSAALAPIFDARQSSSMRGMQAVDLRRSSPVGGMRAPVIAPPSSVRVSMPNIPTEDTSIDVVVEPPPHRGRWIVIAAVAAAIGVIAIVAVSFGLLGGTSGPDEPVEVISLPSSSAAPQPVVPTSAAPAGSATSVHPVPAKGSSIDVPPPPRASAEPGGSAPPDPSIKTASPPANGLPPRPPPTPKTAKPKGGPISAPPLF